MKLLDEKDTDAEDNDGDISEPDTRPHSVPLSALETQRTSESDPAPTQSSSNPRKRPRRSTRRDPHITSSGRNDPTDDTTNSRRHRTRRENDTSYTNDLEQDQPAHSIRPSKRARSSNTTARAIPDNSPVSSRTRRRSNWPASSESASQTVLNNRASDRIESEPLSEPAHSFRRLRPRSPTVSNTASKTRSA
jgi:hypothetical protein